MWHKGLSPMQILWRVHRNMVDGGCTRTWHWQSAPLPLLYTYCNIWTGHDSAHTQEDAHTSHHLIWVAGICILYTVHASRIVPYANIIESICGTLIMGMQHGLLCSCMPLPYAFHNIWKRLYCVLKFMTGVESTAGWGYGTAGSTECIQNVSCMSVSFLSWSDALQVSYYKGRIT